MSFEFMKKKLLVIGSGGQLGSDFLISARNAGYDVTGTDFPHINLADEKSVLKTVVSEAPDIIVNCAAFTAVDLCETEQKNAYALNAEGPKYLALSARETGALLVHFSTDYVFSGDSSTPYTEMDPTEPKTVYGKSKLAGEKNISETWDKNLILRIAWLYGFYGKNFVKTMRSVASDKAASGENLKVVSDQFGSPTWTVDVCNQALKLIELEQTGLFHCTSEGVCSWYDFAAEIIAEAKIPVCIKPCPTEEFPRPAPRPFFSVLENKKLKSLGANLMPHWLEGFRKYLETEAQLKEEKEKR
ncbi:dTDP-4-dehydrorhamnose reductase [Chitinispirillum alkaliphilum]|nr:dTDP-4-dehydrorhamnose reductase [Chitinispirillum alkaliphilum]